MAASALAFAIRTGRILIFSRKDEAFRWRDYNFCPKDNAWDCWFLPISHCKVRKHSDRITKQYKEVTEKNEQAPPVFNDMLEHCSYIKPCFRRYWFITQAVTYIMRFKNSTRHAIDELRRAKLHLQIDNQTSFHIDKLPKGTIAIHIRHSDKIEVEHAQYFDVKAYMEPAERLARGDQNLPVILQRRFMEGNSTFIFPKDRYSNRTLFLSTDDEDAVAKTLKLTGTSLGKQAWQVAYCKLKRKNRWPIWQKVLRYGNKTELLESLMNLEIAISADAWVGTFYSNWCILIDQLRMTAGGKLDLPYLSLNVAYLKECHESFNLTVLERKKKHMT